MTMRTDINPLELNEPFYALICEGKVLFTHPRRRSVELEAYCLGLSDEFGFSAGVEIKPLADVPADARSAA